jgi:hypothetical protein
MINVKSTLNPAIFNSLTSGKTYVVAGNQPWIEVPKGTTLDDVRWIPSHKPEKGVSEARKETFEVEGSKGTKYIVKQAENGSWSCTCVGFGFRRTCKHVTNCKLIINSIKDR